MKITLTKVIRKNTDKDGKPLKTRDGRDYERLAVQTREHGTKWISFFSAPWNAQWKEGDTVEAEVEQKGEYLNGSKPDPLKEILARISALENDVAALKTFMDPKREETPEQDTSLPF